jgi:hypothetical protein
MLHVLRPLASKITRNKLLSRQTRRTQSSDNGITQTSDRFRLKNAPSEAASNKLFQDLNSTGIASMDILHEEDRIYLAEVAKCLPFRDVDAYAGPYQVEQDFKFFDKDHVLDNGHPFMVLKRHYEAWINELFLTRNQYAFQTPFSINEITVNKYHPQSRGIGAHRDHARYLNLVSIFVLEGQGRFFVCSDRNKSNAFEITAPAGSVTLMRAPGLFNFTAHDRPYHYLSYVTSTRVALIMRQDSKYGAEYEK